MIDEYAWTHVDVNSNEHVDVKTLRKKFLEVYGEGPGVVRIFFAPGRVNLIGEHIDYNGGYVLPVALSMGIYAAVRYSETPVGITRGSSSGISPGNVHTVYLASINEPGRISVNLSERILYEPNRGWANYPLGVIQQLQHGRAGYSRTADYNLKGCQVLYWGNLPVGAGLSSSAAIEVLTAYFMLYPVLKDTFHNMDRVWLAQLCKRAENDFVKVQCGIMDQFAVAMGKRNCAMLLDCVSLDYRYVPVMFGDYSLVVMNTGKPRALAQSKYNQRRAECEAALAAIRSYAQYAHLGNLAQATLEQVENTFDLKREHLGKSLTGTRRSHDHKLKEYSVATISDQVIEDAQKSIESVLGRRARHVVTENLRTLEADQALSRGDVAGFGRMMTESHISLRNDYEVTGFELDLIVEAALSLDCCIGARMTGAGFGGCAIALVKSDYCEEFEASVARQYFEKTGLKADFYVCGIEDGVRRLE